LCSSNQVALWHLYNYTNFNIGLATDLIGNQAYRIYFFFFFGLPPLPFLAFCAFFERLPRLALFFFTFLSFFFDPFLAIGFSF